MAQPTKNINIKGLLTKVLTPICLVFLFFSTGLAATPPGTLINNTAQVSYQVGSLPGLPIVSNTDQVTTVAVSGDPDLSADFSQTSLSAGDSATLTLTVTNKSTQTLTNGSLTLSLPADPGNVLNGPLPISKTNQDYVVNLPDIPVAASETLTLTMTVSMNQAAGPISVPIVYTSNGKEMASVTKPLTIQLRTGASIDTLYYDPAGSTPPISVVLTQYDKGDGVYTTIPAPVIPGTTTLVTDGPLSMISESKYHIGQTLFIQVSDGDQNIDSTLQDTTLASLNTTDGKDQEKIRLYETGNDTGIFIAYLPTAPTAAASYDGTLSVTANDKVFIDYQDQVDGADKVSVGALFDPFGLVFDSSTGVGVNGVTITLINAATGQAAQVFGDDGVSSYPSTVVTGQTVIDSAGNVYHYPQGHYRFPLLLPGLYRLGVSLPAGSGYTNPSTVKTSTLQALPGGPFAIDVGSRGKPFVLNPGPPLHLDIPIDPIVNALFVRKEAGKDRVANGDFLQYTVTVENVTSLMHLSNVKAIDRLPHGFRYAENSLRIDGAGGIKPTIGSDGRTLSVPLGGMGPGAAKEFRYVAAVAASKPGKATNQIQAQADGVATSNMAKKSVTVIEDLMRSHTILMGQIVISDSGNLETDDIEKRAGLEGVRIVLEDGTYTVTDDRGMYHFEGLSPGTHVVQIDLSSLPAGYEVLPALKNSRSANRAWSRFVDLQGGTLWREDFYVALKGPTKGKMLLNLKSEGRPDSPTEDITIQLKNHAVPLTHLRLNVMLPKNADYIPGSSTRDGFPLPDPERLGNILTYRLSDRSETDWESLLKFSMRLPEGPGTEDSISKATLIFDTPSQKGKKSGVVSIRHGGPSGSAERSVDTVGLRPGTERTKTPHAHTKDDPKIVAFDQIWFGKMSPAQAGSWLSSKETPPPCNLGSGRQGFDVWLWPSAGHLPPIPSTKVVIKHAPGDRVSLFRDGVPISSFHYEGVLKADTPDGTVSVSRWRGIGLLEGDNHFLALIDDADGNEVDHLECMVHYSGPPASVVFLEDESQLIADGIHAPMLVFQLLDNTGRYPVREGITGAYSVAQPYRPLRETENPISVMPGAPQLKTTYTVGKNGKIVIHLEPTTQTGEVKLTFPLSQGAQEIKARLVPEKREWILVGFAEGTAGYNTLSGNIEALSGAAAEEGFYTDGQLKFYAKGQIKGEWLLTMAFDSEKRTQDDTLFETIDPGTFYTLYGDAGTQRYDAASSEKLYVKLERAHFYALFGDYDTELTVTELSRYQRSLTGLKSEYFGDTTRFNIFVSESNQAYAKESIRAQGISGPYPLTRNTIVMNSEKVTIETRDRFRSEVVISAETPSRHLDYDIDYDTGAITFREPIFSTDARLNPTFIVVEYESFDDTDRSISFGGRAASKPMKNLEVGVSHIHEGKVGGEARLEGLDLSYEITPKTLARAELAQTHITDNIGDRSGEAYVLTMEHRDEKWDALGYLREIEPGYGLGQLNDSESGTRKYGAEGHYRASTHLDLHGRLYRQDNLATDAARKVAELGGALHFWRTHLRAGLKSAKDLLATGEVQRSDLLTLGADRKWIDGKLTLRIDHELPIEGRVESSDFPERTRLGADYQWTPMTTFFAEQEWTDGRDRNTENTRVGIKTTPWENGKMFTTLDRDNNGMARTDSATMGLTQKWVINAQWSLDLGYERGDTFSTKVLAPINTNVPFASGGSGDFSAHSLGLTYQIEKWLWTTRIENRDATSENKSYLASSLQTQVNRDLGLLTSLIFIDKDQLAGGRHVTSNLRFGLAHRPNRGKWIVLDKLDLIHEKKNGVSLPFKNRRIVNNLNANVQVHPHWQLAFQYGAKWVRETIDDQAYDSFIDLVGLESRYDLAQDWDVGLRASVLHSWKTDQVDYAYGISVGHSFVDNVWVSLGYNLDGFVDRDFAGANYKRKGVFLQFRIKFDQESMKDAIDWLKR
ncbi:MAG: hypothetical protein ACE5GK_02190 [Nitrospiria bacterium]